ncbi:MAG: hypothetical protein QM656_14300 [Paracoccaceae bacterium]
MDGTAGVTMGHEWIFDVLEDLRSYAAKNGLTGLVAKTEEALAVAEAEIGGRADPPPEGKGRPVH